MRGGITSVSAARFRDSYDGSLEHRDVARSRNQLVRAMVLVNPRRIQMEDASRWRRTSDDRQSIRLT